MNKEQKILLDHPKKSAQLRVLKKKLKDSIPHRKIQKMLDFEEKFEVDLEHYRINEDDNGFHEAEVRKRARKELMKELLQL